MTAALALAVAQVAANEASLHTIRPADVALIYQVAESHGRTNAARLAWLRRHSSCVLGDEEPEAPLGNCRWSRHLTDSDQRPEGWPEGVPWSRYVRRWRAVRELARRLVTGETEMRPCPEPPWTWGSVRLDTDGAIARGLRPLRCVDPQTGERLSNDGFVRAGGGE